MINFNDIANEIIKANDLDIVRDKYLKLISEHRGRNVISYYSGWLTPKENGNYSIDDMDMNGIINAVSGLPKEKGLDIILHTPGGSPTATEGIVKYLRSNFDDVNVIVPQMAMSAGTMLACSSNKIIMATHSCIGPVEPQFSGIPAYDIKKEFDNAKKEMTKNPASATYWSQILNKYPSVFYNIVKDAIDLSSELLKEWLRSYMFSDDSSNPKISEIVKKLNSNNKSHAKHFCYDDCVNIGLKVEKLESDAKLHDLVLALHYSYNFTFNNAVVSKIIENHKGMRFII